MLVFRFNVNENKDKIKKKLRWNLENNKIILTYSCLEYDRTIDSEEIFNNKLLKLRGLLEEEEEDEHFFRPMTKNPTIIREFILHRP